MQLIYMFNMLARTEIIARFVLNDQLNLNPIHYTIAPRICLIPQKRTTAQRSTKRGTYCAYSANAVGIVTHEDLLRGMFLRSNEAYALKHFIKNKQEVTRLKKISLSIYCFSLTFQG